MRFLSAAVWLGVLLALSSYRVAAQQCSGTVLYKEDFGGSASDPDIGNPLPAGVTGYTFTTGTVSDGLYSIRKTVPKIYQSWVSGSDHTGDGYMMVVNASYTAGLFYETRIDGLCQGSSIYFSAWVANLIKASASDPLDPNLRFVIRRASDSTIIDSLETGFLPRFSTLTWQQHGIHFDLPAGESSVILQIFNHQTGGSGNDLVLDDISISLCGPTIDLSESGVYQHSDDVCQGTPVKITADVETGFYHHPAYQWQFSRDSLNWQDIPGQVNTSVDIPSASAADSGFYRLLTAEEGNIGQVHCRAASPAIALHVFGVPHPEITTNGPVCEGSELYLESPQGLAYQWTGPGGFHATGERVDFPAATPGEAGDYSLTLTSRGGCTSRASATVAVEANTLQVSLGEDSLLCEGDRIHLDVTNAGAAYQWNTGEQSPTLEVDTGGYYQVTVTRGLCSRSDSLSVREVMQPRADLGSDTTICYGEPFQLDATSPDAEAYLWQDGSTAPVLAVHEAGAYAVSVSNICGVATSTVVIATQECADHLLYPTAFSPNGDGQNDVFRPRVLISVSSYHIRIMDRWGRTVFVSGDPAAGWDGRVRGTPAPLGTYVWVAGYVRQRDHQSMVQKGTITLIR